MWYPQIYENIFLPEIFLSCSLRVDSAPRTEIVRDFPQGKRYKKPSLDRNGQASGIISAKFRKFKRPV
jgi:hypothetical protein